MILVPLWLADSGEKYLSALMAFQQQSYFKLQVYNDHNWKSFEMLKEPNVVVNPDAYDFHLLNAAVFYATNKLREEKKLKSLTFSPSLRDAAVVHTYQMVDKKFFSHVNSKTPRLKQPDERMRLFGAKCKAYAENIDWNNMPMPSNTTYKELAEKIVDAWFHSAPHKKNMLNKNLSHLGCAVVFEPKNSGVVRYLKATQDFSLE